MALMRTKTMTAMTLMRTKTMTELTLMMTVLGLADNGRKNEKKKTKTNDTIPHCQ